MKRAMKKRFVLSGAVAKRFWLFVVGIFFIGGLVAIVRYAEMRSMRFFPASAPAAAVASTTPDVQVLYAADGFAPRLLDVPLGARVAFKNMTSEPLWTASDPYPTHADYPEFNAGKIFNVGETYVFQFERAGTFGYDNDEKTTDRGFIHVTDPNASTTEIDSVPVGQRATRDKLLALFQPGDLDSIFAVFDAIQADPALSMNCHEIGHDLGHRAYELYGFSGAMTFNNPDRLSHASVEEICAGGYMHGVLEELFYHQPELKNDPGAMCADVPAQNRGTCFHGIGHALMFVNKRDVAASLAGCRSLALSADTHRCFEGVWMELFWGTTEHSGPNTLGWNFDEPLAPCVATQSDAKPACFLYAAFGYLRVHPKDYAGAVNLCTINKLDDGDAAYCLQGIGIASVGHFGGKNLEQAETFVAGLNDAQKIAFYDGLMGYGLLSGITRDDLTATCNAMKTDQSLCLTALAGQ